MNNPQNPYNAEPPQPPQSDSPESLSVEPKPANLRTGKIARLPKAVRDTINQMICDGFTYLEIIHALGDVGKGMLENNLATWKAGGYQDWLKEQQRLDEMRVQQEFAIDLVRANDGTETHQAALQVAALRVLDVLSQFDSKNLKAALQN